MRALARVSKTDAQHTIIPTLLRKVIVEDRVDCETHHKKYCAVHTLLKVTNTNVCKKQHRGKSLNVKRGIYSSAKPHCGTNVSSPSSIEFSLPNVRYSIKKCGEKLWRWSRLPT
jgi:hypothetical protein